MSQTRLLKVFHCHPDPVSDKVASDHAISVAMSSSNKFCNAVQKANGAWKADVLNPHWLLESSFLWVQSYVYRTFIDRCIGP